MKKSVLLSLAASLLLWPGAAGAAQPTRHPDGPAYTRALNHLYAYMASQGMAPSGPVERKGDTFEATAVKGGRTMHLVVDVKSGTVHEAQG